MTELRDLEADQRLLEIGDVVESEHGGGTSLADRPDWQRPATLVRILRQVIESDSFRYIVERRHLSGAADEIERLEKENKLLEDYLRIACEQFEELERLVRNHFPKPPKAKPQPTPGRRCERRR